MSEQAFSPDFLFSTLTNLHFGDDLFMAVTSDFGGAADQNVPTINAIMSFPGMAGGTPGISIRTPLHSYPYVVTKTDLSLKTRTAAGLPLSGGFGIGNPPLNSFNNPPLANQLSFSSDVAGEQGYSNGAQFIIAPPSSKPFSMSINWQAIATGDSSSTASISLACFFVKRSKLLGATLPLTLPAQYPSPLQASYTPFGTSTGGTVNFHLDPVKGTVALLTPDQ